MAKKNKTGAEHAQERAKILVYKWAGKWGPFKVKIPCGECALTTDVIDDTLAFELANAEVDFEVRDWLSNWWKPLFKGGWHAPIVMVNGEVLAQGHALNRGVLAETVINSHVENFPMKGTHVFGKEKCGHCTRAKDYMARAGVEYAYHDVVKNPGAMYEMIARVKPLIGKKTPITTPQVWIDGEYVGGADALRDRFGFAEDQRAAAPAENYWAKGAPQAA
ncbi:MAG: glutaredoxin [Pseudomonadota bacterium]